MSKARHFACNDRVRFASKWLRNTGQFTGPEAPCSEGPFARGMVTRVDRLNAQLDVVEVVWDGGALMRVLSCNLERAQA